MQYRRLGRSGLKISAIAFGTGSGGYPANGAAGREFLAAALDAGVNFFDTAEVYGGGESERILGDALKALKWPRLKCVVATKFSIGLARGPNESNTLNRKYLLSAIDGSLSRLKLDHVDIAYCHWPDPHTPIEETVWAMHSIIESGKARYWGTSNFSAEQIRAARAVADRHHLHKPIVEQSEYNLLYRNRIENELRSLTEDEGLGIVAYSPLAGGLLTGKYLGGVPADSRAAAESFKYVRLSFFDAHRSEIVGRLKQIADELEISLTSLALAWCLASPRVSAVVLGGTRLEQITGNLRALDAIPLLTREVEKRLRTVLGTYDNSWLPPNPNLSC